MDSLGKARVAQRDQLRNSMPAVTEQVAAKTDNGIKSMGHDAREYRRANSGVWLCV